MALSKTYYAQLSSSQQRKDFCRWVELAAELPGIHPVVAKAVSQPITAETDWRLVDSLLLNAARLVVGLHLAHGDKSAWHQIAACINRLSKGFFLPLKDLIEKDDVAYAYFAYRDEDRAECIALPTWIRIVETLGVSPHSLGVEHPQVFVADRNRGAVHYLPLYYAFYHRMTHKCGVDPYYVPHVFFSLPFLAKKDSRHALLEHASHRWLSIGVDHERLELELDLFVEAGYPPPSPVDASVKDDQLKAAYLSPSPAAAVTESLPLGPDSPAVRRTTWVRECCILLAETMLCLDAEDPSLLPSNKI